MGRRRKRKPIKNPREKTYIYEYRCTSCGHIFSTGKQGLEVCEKCGCRLKLLGRYSRSRGQRLTYPGRGPWITPEDLYKPIEPR